MSEAKHVLTEQLQLIEKEERRLAYKRFKSLQSLDPDTNEHISSYKNDLMNYWMHMKKHRQMKR